ncbi:hypothetical protein TNCV_245951 [Trichonephila clavipes]|nr:hypothetical protein TNCV_245951 [Trichonephila clavipes]
MELKMQSLLSRGNHALAKFLHAHGWSTQNWASLVERKSPSPNLHTALTGGAHRIDCSGREGIIYKGGLKVSKSNRNIIRSLDSTRRFVPAPLLSSHRRRFSRSSPSQSFYSSLVYSLSSNRLVG